VLDVMVGKTAEFFFPYARYYEYWWGIEAQHRLRRSGFSLSSCSPALLASASPDQDFVMSVLDG